MRILLHIWTQGNFYQNQNTFSDFQKWVWGTPYPLIHDAGPFFINTERN